VQAFSGVSQGGGFKLRQAIDINFKLDSNCSEIECYCAVGTCTGGATPGAQCFIDGDCAGGTCSTNPKKCTGGTAAGTPTPTTTGAYCNVDGDCLGGGKCKTQPVNGATCTSDADCSGFPGQVSPGVCAACPPDTCPLQDGELQIAGEITSGQSKGIIWNLNNTTLIVGTSGPGNGSNICGTLLGGPVCHTEITGTPIDLTGVGGSCLADVPPTLSGATVSLAYPAIDIDPTIGDFIATLTLQCQ
jgi:hypothetical protein